MPLDLLTKSVDKCAKHVLAIQNRVAKNVNSNRVDINLGQCRDGSGIFAACFSREVFTTCPDELRSDSKRRLKSFDCIRSYIPLSGDDCNSLRDYIGNCSPVGGVRELAQFAFNASFTLTDDA